VVPLAGIAPAVAVDPPIAGGTPQVARTQAEAAVQHTAVELAAPAPPVGHQHLAHAVQTGTPVVAPQVAAAASLPLLRSEHTLGAGWALHLAAS